MTRHRIFDLFRQNRLDREIAREFAFHLRESADRLVEDGMSEPEAAREAGRRFGNRTRLKESTREAGLAVWLDSVLKDVRYAVRVLLRNRAFTTTAVLSLGLGIGANVAIFSLVNGLFLRPLPVRDPATLAALFGLTGRPGERRTAAGVSWLNIQALASQSTSVSAIAAFSSATPLGFTRAGTSQGVFTELVSANYFDVLGVRPAAGRFFAPDEGKVPGTAPVVVISHGAWQRRFGGSTGALGSTVRLNGLVFTVVGVAPPGFKGVNSFFGPELWVPATMAPALLGPDGKSLLEDRQVTAFTAVARLAPGVGLRAAQSELDAIARRLAEQDARANRNAGFRALPIAEATVFPGLRDSILVGGVALMGIAGLVLLVACANVAALLLAKASSRRHEVAVRQVLGANQARLTRQMLVESLVLGLLGGVVGLTAAVAGREVLWALRPPIVAENLVKPELDVAVMGFAALISLVAGVLFGATPAMWAARQDPVEAINRSSPRSSASPGRALFRRALVIGQTALSLVCVMVGGLFLRSVQAAYRSDPGFETERLALLPANPAEAGYGAARSEQYFRRAKERVERLPGVVAAAWASNSPLFAFGERGVRVPGADADDDGGQSSSVVNVVDAGYFTATGIALLSGRPIGALDREQSNRVAVVNAAFAARYLGGQQAMGRRVRIGSEKLDREIVGVVKTAKMGYLGEPPRPCVYVPMTQDPQRVMVLHVRTSGDPRRVLALAERELAAEDKNVPVTDASTVHELISNNLFITRTAASLLTLFGLLALGLASVGLYGTMAYSVSQRRREIAVRMALGAQPSTIRLGILGDGLRLVGPGLLLGLALEMAASRGLSAALSGVSPADPVTLVSAVAVLALVGLGAAYVPALRASRLDPITALRES